MKPISFASDANHFPVLNLEAIVIRSKASTAHVVLLNHKRRDRNYFGPKVASARMFQSLYHRKIKLLTF